MKKVYLLLVAFFITLVSVNAQPWITNLKKETKKDNFTFFEIQKAFNDYWAKKGVTDGYYYENGTRKKAAGWKQFKRWEYIWEPRVDPNTGYFTPLSEIYDSYQKFKKSSKADAASWSNVGPIKLPTNILSQPNGLGRLNAVIFHPTDASTFFVCAPSGGFWKTTDNGQTWKNLTEELATIGSSYAVIDPNNPDIIYIGTGDRDAGDSQGLGVYKSTDGGSTWTRVLNIDYTVYMMLMDPNDNNHVIAATANGIYVTKDAGATWTQTSTEKIKDIEFKPGDPSVVYGANKVLYKSTDGGDTWTDKTSNLNVSATIGRMVITVSKNQPDWLYVFVTDDSYAFEGLYLSKDTCHSFTKASYSPNLLGYKADGSDDGTQAWYDLCIVADPNDASTVYVGGVNIWKSKDAGSTWNITAHWVGDNADDIHADQHDLAFSPDGSKLYSCNDGGIYYSDDNGATWTDISSGLAIAQVYKIGQSYKTKDLVINGYQDNGTAVTTGQDNFTSVIGGDGMECIIDYTDDDYRYGALYYGDIRRFVSSGYYYTIVNDITSVEKGAWVTPYVLHRSNPNIMFAGYNNLWISKNVKAENSGDVSWTKITDVSSSNTIRVVENCRANNDIVYISAYDFAYRIENATSSSPTIVNIYDGMPYYYYASDFETDPRDENIVYMTMYKGVFKSTDKGASWTNITGNLPTTYMNNLVLDTIDYTLYVATYTGVYRLKDGESDWEMFSNGLPVVDVRELEIFYSPDGYRTIKAATYGRGLWESPVNTSQNDAAIVDIIKPIDTYCEPPVDVKPIVVIANKGKNNLTSLKISYFFDSQDEVTYSWTGNLAYGETDTVELSQISITDGNHTFKAVASLPNGNTDENKSNNEQSLNITASEIPFPYTQEFDKQDIPPCWTVNDNIDDGGIVWEFTNPGNRDFASSTNSNGFAIVDVDYYGGQSNTDLISPTFDLTENSQVKLVFEQAFNKYETDKAELYYSTDGGANWSLLQSYTDDEGSLNSPATFDMDISDKVGGKDSVVLRWHYEGNDDWYWAIDDIKLTTSSTAIDKFDTETFVMYPNPAKDFVKLSLSKVYTNVQVSVFDVAGRKIIDKKYSNVEEITLNMRNHSKGVYIINLNIDGKTKTGKLILK